ncbi:MAG: hypothetical protein F6K55_45555 [Moorea sp. SIO4A3]|nr:hypothetical protein [Moorena sp. SIO4A3]
MSQVSQLCGQCNGFLITIDRKSDFGGGEFRNYVLSATVFSTVESVGRSRVSSAFPLASCLLHACLLPVPCSLLAARIKWTIV